MENKTGVFKGSMCYIILLLIILLCGCQPTPDEGFTNNKNIDNIVSDNSPSIELNNSEESITPNGKITERKDYGSNQLNIDAQIYIPQIINAPQIRVGLKNYKDGNAMKEFVESIYPDVRIYKNDGFRTSDVISSEIVDVKRLIAIAKENPIVKNEDGITVIYDLEILQESLLALEEEYRQTKNYTLPPPSYEFQNDNGIQYSSFKYVFSDGSYKNLIIQNSEQGNLFSLETDNTIIDQQERYLTINEVENDVDFKSAKELADTMVKKMGGDNMILNAACYGTVADQQTQIKNAAQCLYYVPEYNDIPLTYVANHLGTSALNVDGNDVYMNLIGPEYIRVCVYNNQVESLFWKDPLEVLNVEVEECNLLPWSNIEDLFYNQMGRIFNDSGHYSDSIININRIEFGLTKVLIQSEGNAYRLIPTWNFFGTIVKKEGQVDVPLDIQEICILTIDAVNGNYIDRGLMY